MECRPLYLNQEYWKVNHDRSKHAAYNSKVHNLPFPYPARYHFHRDRRIRISLRKSLSGELTLLQQARAIVENNTILDIPDDPALEYGMIRGMLAELNDPYTYFVEPAAHEVESNDLSGSFGGIGARLERDTDLNWRLYPCPIHPRCQPGWRTATSSWQLTT